MPAVATALLQGDGASAPVQAALPRAVQALLEAVAPEAPASAATLPQVQCSQYNTVQHNNAVKYNTIQVQYRQHSFLQRLSLNLKCIAVHSVQYEITMQYCMASFY
jgi:hypothetical protein